MKKTELKQLVKEELDNVMREIADEPAAAPIDGEVDEEGGMVKSELLYIADKAQGCADKIQSSDQQLEAWVQSHISAAKELISHVADYMGYGEEAEEETSKETPETGEEVAGEETDELKEAIVDPIEKAANDKIAAALDAKAVAIKKKATDIKAGKTGPASSLSESETSTYYDEKDGYTYRVDDEGNRTRIGKGNLTGGGNHDSGYTSGGGYQERENDKWASREQGLYEKKVTREAAEKTKDAARQALEQGKHENVLKMIKKLEKYVKEK